MIINDLLIYQLNTLNNLPTIHGFLYYKRTDFMPLADSQKTELNTFIILIIHL